MTAPSTIFVICLNALSAALLTLTLFALHGIGAGISGTLIALSGAYIGFMVARP